MDKIVDFTLCRKCVHRDEPDAQDPCHECLNNPANEDSRIPINFKSEEKE